MEKTKNRLAYYADRMEMNKEIKALFDTRIDFDINKLYYELLTYLGVSKKAYMEAIEHYVHTTYRCKIIDGQVIFERNQGVKNE